MNSRWTAADVPDQTGRTAIVTGANSGIGFEAAATLANRGAHVVLAVRDLDKGADAAARITAGKPPGGVGLQELDLASLESVRSAAKRIKATHSRIDLLVNNAGVMFTPKQITPDGFELQFGTNHLGHFALTGLLMDQLLATPGSRVVTISSLAHRMRAAIRFDDLSWERSYDPVAAYGQSKLANLMFTYELQRRLASDGAATMAVAAHPGAAETELFRYTPALTGQVMFQSAADGALPTLRAATDRAVRGGEYYGPDGPDEYRGSPTLVRSSEQSHNVDLQHRLWAVSEELTGVIYPV